MKIFLWVVTGLMALFWTLGAWAVASVLGWAAGAATPGSGVDVAAVISSWALPAWVTWLIDPGLVSAALGGIVWAFEHAQSAWPWLGQMLSWLVPMIWVVWALGLVFLLLLALFLQWVVRQIGTPEPVPPAHPA